MAFGERLQLLRRRSGLTQEQFAEQLQVSRQAVSKWEVRQGLSGDREAAVHLPAVWRNPQ